MPRTIMIDLETLGSVPGCSIVAIGATASTDDGFVTDTFYIVVSRSSCVAYGLRESVETLDWWSRQSEQAREVIAQAEDPAAATLPDALAALNVFVSRHGKVEVYGNGSDFDNAILAVAADAAHVVLAWPFWANRCYRTIKSRMPWIRMDRQGTHHNALDDARSQARHLGRLNREMAMSADKAFLAIEFIGWMADRFQRRTARRLLGIRFNRISRRDAIEHARTTFDASMLDAPFLDPAFSWDRDGAVDLVDSELEHWDD